MFKLFIHFTSPSLWRERTKWRGMCQDFGCDRTAWQRAALRRQEDQRNFWLSIRCSCLLETNSETISPFSHIMYVCMHMFYIYIYILECFFNVLTGMSEKWLKTIDPKVPCLAKKNSKMSLSIVFLSWVNHHNSVTWKVWLYNVDKTMPSTTHLGMITIPPIVLPDYNHHYRLWSRPEVLVTHLGGADHGHQHGWWELILNKVS